MFDPYHKWLGILTKDQPPNHYRLLSLELFESDLDVIEGAADRQMGFVRQYQSGEYAVDAARILNEVAAARLCLLKASTKAAYDARLRREMAAAEPEFPKLSSEDLQGELIPRSRKKKREKVVIDQGLMIKGGIALVAVLVVVMLLRGRSLPPVMTPAGPVAESNSAKSTIDERKPAVNTSATGSKPPSATAAIAPAANLGPSPATKSATKLDTVPPSWKTFVAATSQVHSVDWTPDERHVVATSWDNKCRVWEVESGRLIKEFQADGSTAILMPDGEHIVVFNMARKKLVRFRWSTGELIQEFDNPRNSDFRSLDVSPDGNRIAAGEEPTGTGTSTVWNVATGAVLKSFTAHKGGVNAVCLTPDGRLITGGEDHLRILWDIDTGKELSRWSTPGLFVAALDVSFDGKYLVESGGSKEIFVRDMATLKVVQTLRGHEVGWVMRCLFQKDASRIVTSCADKTIRVWDATDGRELLAIRGFRNYQFGLALSPSGALLAAGSGGDRREDGQWWGGDDFDVRLYEVR